jgi:hypothetical protein
MGLRHAALFKRYKACSRIAILFTLGMVLGELQNLPRENSNFSLYMYLRSVKFIAEDKRQRFNNLKCCFPKPVLARHRNETCRDFRCNILKFKTLILV